MATLSNLTAPLLPLALCAVLVACSESNTTSNDASELAAKPQITVYKSESCGCCGEWATYLGEEGFDVTAINHEDMQSVKSELGLPSRALESCHTAVIGDYLVEGHVPASDILRLIKEQAKDIKGLSAPGMPMLSPGMNSREPKDYDVLAFTADGETSVYSRY